MSWSWGSAPTLWLPTAGAPGLSALPRERPGVEMVLRVREGEGGASQRPSQPASKWHAAGAGFRRGLASAVAPWDWPWALHLSSFSASEGRGTAPAGQPACSTHSVRRAPLHAVPWLTLPPTPVQGARLLPFY